MQRIFNVNKWVTLSSKKALEFSSKRPRVVRLEVNSPGESFLYVTMLGEDEDHFLARVVGRDTVEFYSSGAFTLSVEEGECNVYTVDGSDVSHVNLAPKVFTRLAERRKRNPELEYIAHTMQINLERRLAKQANELRAEFERREASRRVPETASVPGSAGSERAQDQVPGDDPVPGGAPKGSKAKG